MRSQPTNLQYSASRALTEASQAPPRQGIYRLFRQGQLLYVGQAKNLRTRLMQHLLCLTHFQITPAPYQFRVALTAGRTQPARRRIERRLIDWHQQRGRLPQQREFEFALGAVATESELAQAVALQPQCPSTEAENFAVQRVVAVAPQRGQPPRFRVVGAPLSPMAARSVARRMPGVFVTGAAQQARAFANRLAAAVRGRVEGPEHHGAGLSHFHVIHPQGMRTHIWYGWQTPRGEFMG